MLSARRQFLDAYLGALGAGEILNYSETSRSVNGTLRYAPDTELMDLSDTGEDELQDFSWEVSEDRVPSPLAYQLVDLIQRFRLLDVDCLRISRDTLYAITLQDFETRVNREDFDQALDELKAIQVALIDDGEETDVFFIRELSR